MKEKIQRGGGEEREDCIYVSILPWWDLSNERGRRGKCGCFSAYVNAQLQLLSLFEFPLKEEECERGEREGIKWKVRRAKWKQIEECKIINILRWNGIRLPIPIVDCPARFTDDFVANLLCLPWLKFVIGFGYSTRPNWAFILIHSLINDYCRWQNISITFQFVFLDRWQFLISSCRKRVFEFWIRNSLEELMGICNGVFGGFGIEIH